MVQKSPAKLGNSAMVFYFNLPINGEWDERISGISAVQVHEWRRFITFG